MSRERFAHLREVLARATELRGDERAAYLRDACEDDAALLEDAEAILAHEGDNPARWHRLFWAGVLGTLPIFMVFVGGLEVIRSGVLIASLPLLLVGLAMACALVKSLRQH